MKNHDLLAGTLPPAIAALRGCSETEDAGQNGTSAARPFWSVMIPAFNPNPDYFKDTLASVLRAGRSESEMQIEVLDNASTACDVEGLVRSIAGNRIAVHRQPESIGGLENWNACIRRARGEWVHILHADDFVLPGFYERMHDGLRSNATAGAAFCRHVHITAAGDPVYLSETEQNGPGELSNWLSRLAVRQRIQCAAIVVRRAAYEKLGGFWSKPGHALDWEMWMRISAHYPVWYHPEPMACYRLHSASGSSILLDTAAVTRDMGRAIDIAAAYLPIQQRAELVRLGKQHYARCALENAQSLAAAGRTVAAIAHVEAALELAPSPQNAAVAEQVVLRVVQPKTGGSGNGHAEASDPIDTFFSTDEVRNIEDLVRSYQQNPPEAAGELNALRHGLGSFLTAADPKGLEHLFKSNFGKVYRMFLNSGLQNQALTAEESETARLLADSWRRRSDLHGDIDLRQLAAYMLFRIAHDGSVPTALERIPRWFRHDYLAYVFKAPQGFARKGEAADYHHHLLGWIQEIDRRICVAPNEELTLDAALFCARNLNVIMVYFTRANVKELMVKRARILEFVLAKSGAEIDFAFPARPANRRRIKVGYLNAHFAPQTETYTTLPTIHLDPGKFEIALFALQTQGGVLEDYCRARGPLFELPATLKDQVAAIREAALDAIFIGTNVTAVTNQIALLALHRLAPLQIVTYSSPLTSGMRHVDGYLTGTLTNCVKNDAHHSEKLLVLDGPPNCFEFSADSGKARARFDRQSLGIPEDAIVFVSGATCYKILPEVQETWARILKAVDGSRLLLIPFNPNWSSAFPVKLFEHTLSEVFQRHGVDKDRVVLSPSFPNRWEVRAFQKLGDIYLDTYPFSGSVSIMDPLELGIPPVVWEADTHRSRLAAALLRDIHITDLIATDEESYIFLAIKLATDASYRTRVSADIRERMAANPRFMDCEAYGRNLGNLIEELLRSSAADCARGSNEDLLQLGIEAHTNGRAVEAEAIYRQILADDPHSADAWHLLGVLAHQSGKSEMAADFIDQAIQLAPENATFWNNLGEAWKGTGDARKPIASYRRALELQPDFPEALLNLAVALSAAGENGEAMALFKKAVRLKPDNFECLVEYGLGLHTQKRFKEAIPVLKKACAAAPSSAEARCHLASAFEAAKRYAEAFVQFKKASQLDPDLGEVWHRWGKLLLAHEDYPQALEVLQRAVQCNPDSGEYHYRHACALQLCRRPADALAGYNKAIECGWDTPELHNHRGIVLKDLGKYEEAIQSYHRAITLKPEMVSAINNLGAVCTDLGLTSEALECYSLVIQRRPDFAITRNNIAKLLKDCGNAEEALASYRKSLELNPNAPEVNHNFLLCLQYLPEADPETVFQEHRGWGARVARKTRGGFAQAARKRAAGKKLRIGYVSPDFWQHPVATFIEPLLALHDRTQFEVHAYSDVKAPDAVTARLRTLPDVWRDTSSLNDRALAQAVWNDEIDILVDLTGHTALNRLEMFALKPAPVQVSYLGYPATTGLPTIDFRITDSLADPPGTTDSLYTERLVRLPGCAWCYCPPDESPSVAPPPSDNKGHVTFGCFNQIAKLNPPLLELWLVILNRVPGSHLKLKARTLLDPCVRARLARFFIERGIVESRLEFSGFAPTVRGHLEAYHSVDIALDTFPYHGTTTTCEALWMGVPVLTLAGRTHVSRVGVSLLTAIGFGDLIVESRERYVDLAVNLAEDRDRLRRMRAALRPKMTASPLMDRAGFARAMDAALLRIAPR